MFLNWELCFNNNLLVINLNTVNFVKNRFDQFLMKNYLFFLVVTCLSLNSIVAQKSDFQLKGEFLHLTRAPVTLLMKDRSTLQGVIKMDYVYTIHFEMQEGIKVLKKKNIFAVIPGNAVFEDLEDSVFAKDLIIIKNSVWLFGEIIEIGPKSVRFSMENSMFDLALTQVIKIYPKGLDISFLSITKGDDGLIKPVKLEKLKRQFEKNGIYHIVYANVASQNEILEESFIESSSFGGQYILGCQFSQRFGAGFGVGYLDYYNPLVEDRPKFIPVFADVRGYLSDKKTSVYYNLAIGLTTGTKINEDNLINIKPGLYTHPAIGYKIGSDKLAFLIDLGIQMSNIEYEVDVTNPGFSGSTVIETYDTRRIVLRLGMMF